MKILVDGAALSRAVAHVVRVFDKNQPLIRLTAGDGGLVIEASGAESFSRAVVEGDLVEPDSVAVNGLWLSALAAAMPAGEVSVSTAGAGLRLSGDGSRFDMGLAVEAMISDPPHMPEVMLDVDAVDWESAVSSVAHAAATSGEMQRTPVMEGAHLSGTLIEASNRFRAARATLPVELDADVVVRADWLKANMSGVESVGVEYAPDGSPRMFAVKAGMFCDMTTVIGGEFPHLDRVWPQRGDGMGLTFDRAALLSAVKRLKTADFSKKTGKPVIFAPNEADGTVLLSLTDGESSTGGSQRLDADVVDVSEIRLALNAQYMIDALSSLTGEYVELWTADGMQRRLKPCLMYCEGDVSEQLVTPVRV